MFWTHWVRGICKVLMVIEIIASIVVGSFLIDEASHGPDDYIFIGIVVMIVGVLIAITSNALIMMISEISVNIYELKQMQNGNKNESIRTVSSQAKQPSESWVCNCGARNSNDSKVCSKCGKTKDGTPSHTYSHVRPTSSNYWYCKKCGTKNDFGASFCKNCGEYK